MTTQTQPRQLARDPFVARLRELLDEGLDHDMIIEKMNPVRGFGVIEDFMRDALDTIASALAIASEVSNARMQQAWADFIHSEQRAIEEADKYVKHCAHIEKMYPDPNIRRAKRIVLDAMKDKWRENADKASVDWATIQRKRIPFDVAREKYPTAFEDFPAWQPKPLK